MTGLATRQARFHVLEAAGERVYGYGSDYASRESGLLVSDDGGRSWQERVPPEPLISLAIDTGDPDRAVASGEKGTYSTSNRTGLAPPWGRARPLGLD